MNTLTHICESCSTHGPRASVEICRARANRMQRLRDAFAHWSYLDVARALFIKKKKRKKGKRRKRTPLPLANIYFFPRDLSPLPFPFFLKSCPDRPETKVEINARSFVQGNKNFLRKNERKKKKTILRSPTFQYFSPGVFEI